MKTLAKAVMMCAVALVTTESSFEAKLHHYFPDSQLVLEMATLSHAVYHLRNKVTSCLDDEIVQTNNNNNISPYDRNSTDFNGDGDDNNIFRRLLPVGTKCMYYSHDYSLGTQVLVVRSNLYNYIAVAYAGTDDWRTALIDGDILMSNFGPRIVENQYKNNITNNSGTWDNSSDDIRSIFKNVPDGIRVHRGFNEAVFNSIDFPKLWKCIASARFGGECCNDVEGSGCAGEQGASLNPNRSSPYQLLTTGHSLGAADSVLLGAALHLAYPNENMRSINFGGPKIGNIAWSFWMNSLQPDKENWGPYSTGSYEIFRLVNKIDLVPRLPEPLLSHAGHTLQMSVGGGIKAYYDHIGDEDVGYAGVPFGWEEAPYALLPLALASHPCYHYVEYLDYYKPNSTSENLSSLYYVDDFERTEESPSFALESQS